MGTKWDIRAEAVEGLSINPSTGESGAEAGTRIRYRKQGSRGRFRSFVVVGDLAGTLPEIVDKYEEQRKR